MRTLAPALARRTPVPVLAMVGNACFFLMKDVALRFLQEADDTRAAGAMFFTSLTLIILSKRSKRRSF